MALIAHVSTGLAKYPLDDPRLGEVLANLEKIYAEVEAAPGFVWRPQDEDIFADLAAHGQHPQTLMSLSVWTDVAALKAYTFAGLHKHFMDRSREWFEEPTEASLAIWEVAEDARPTVADGLERIAHLRANGPSAFAFGWDGPGED